ncbi:DNA alkylation repair protein [Corynebacterium sp. 153RC1]|uniref:DNA alkylation repair protein n=1 Tax=unclassified Corynebacterium TaxID=2624378 RepID=UPI00211BC525|nr:DNA alkylation repair protein [Corynebacterium sp. 209RC1]MCQ9354813.1 DNA alkylation repair protein [Corynebacterium sp. 1222RC1]MCQ9356998.1 DNA alkylation repair protein [Corynebacterium sp. 122RC1]MCQ9359081.1 DNA alkylation repair protein [Corynebacterium sp. 142RC1]MCQ9361466.1 DNA alkylation repair protein [Corynebacterium sp. 153RC1]MCQ9363591.1 DNA alkylation repair protein [Corynebacterium sp. 732RC1]MCQ9365576.1 DNA alkylation repair protein [Corynebacterium sp. 70RC1]
MNIQHSAEEALAPLHDPVRAAGQSAYLKHQFSFLGVATTQRRAATKHIVRALRDVGKPELLAQTRQLWQMPYREYHYVACDILRAYKHPLAPDELRYFICTHSWWDTVDALVKVVGANARSGEMLAWAKEENLWIRRTAILHQLGMRSETDPQLMAAIIEHNAADQEFFIRKAIGWALREYAKTNPDWVMKFLERTPELSGLSRREALKHLEQG